MPQCFANSVYLVTRYIHLVSVNIEGKEGVTLQGLPGQVVTG